jgi:hypothetical protein
MFSKMPRALSRRGAVYTHFKIYLPMSYLILDAVSFIVNCILQILNLLYIFSRISGFWSYEINKQLLHIAKF